MSAPPLFEPGPRSAAIRELGPILPLAHLLPPPVHYAMAGGGAHGAVQWGLLQALSETNVIPDSIIGTSAGALSGVVYAEDPPSGLNRLAYVWGQLDAGFLVGEGWLGRLGNARSSALLDNDTERATLETLLSARSFAELAMPFATVATDLATGQTTIIDSGDLIEALLASSAIPGLLPPVEIGGRLLIDGLASANLPAVPALSRGAGSIVVLDTGGRDPGPLGTGSRRVLARMNVALSVRQRADQLLDAAQHVPVVLLPTPGGLTGALDFRGTMSSAAQAFILAREFLHDLLRMYDGELAPGLFARADARGLGGSIHDVLFPVVTHE